VEAGMIALLRNAIRVKLSRYRSRERLEWEFPICNPSFINRAC
jgi:hypothetical protein